jgi:hypothetical protein
VKTPRPIEEPGALTRRSKDPSSLRLGVAASMAQTPKCTSARQPIFLLSWHALVEQVSCRLTAGTLNKYLT